MSADAAGSTAGARVIACAPNFRDVAERVPGLRRGLLFRSDLVFDPDPDGGRAIAACGIRLVIDLRSPFERGRLPNRWFEAAGVEVIAVDVSAQGDTGRTAGALRADAGAQGAHALMLDAYRSFPARALFALRMLGERIAAGDLPVLVHCAAGKDRTGFVIAALLAALGIDREAVAADYLASEGRVHPRTRDHTRAVMHRTFGALPDEAALAALGGVHPDYLAAAFAAAAAHGSLDAYLAATGLAGVRLRQVGARLLA